MKKNSRHRVAAYALAMSVGSVAFLAGGGPAAAQGTVTIDGQTCLATLWREESHRSVPTKKARKRALKRARRQWERGVRNTYGSVYGTLKNARQFSQGCTKQGVCHVTARPCSDSFDKG